MTLLNDCKRLLEWTRDGYIPSDIRCDQIKELSRQIAPKSAKAIVRVRQRIADCIAASERDAVYVRMTLPEARELLELLD